MLCCGFIGSSLTKESHSEDWRSKVNTPAYNTWMGYMFESLCYKHIKTIRRALDIGAGAMAPSTTKALTGARRINRFNL